MLEFRYISSESVQPDVYVNLFVENSTKYIESLIILLSYERLILTTWALNESSRYIPRLLSMVDSYHTESIYKTYLLKISSSNKSEIYHTIAYGSSIWHDQDNVW